MDMRKAFPSAFLKAADIDGSATYTISSVAMETVGEDTKPVIKFAGEKRGLVLNKTNSERISAVLGYDSDDWSGRKVELCVEKIPFQGGRLVDGIVVRVPKQGRTTKAQAAVGMQAPFDDGLDGIV